ncbi:MFS transporter [Niallia taxi]|uniref:MFS transporter n=1 Tax=Niallia taxi TaxID=2499688 RepID=UPI0012448DF2|nr:MFS transporter [Niallia taxi]MED4056278.1 MFS transporter [Niallia taxi]MED4119763.1 MFS transporter [Niallia taxi]
MKWKSPLLLLVGIGISNIGAWVYLIALNLIILDMTKSPLAVSILYMLLPIATLVTNFWSGTFIDRFNKRTLMILLNLIRAIFIFTLPFFESLFLIYLVVFIINIANTIFEPTSMVYMTKLISKTHRQKFNAFRNFINSCGFILGPSIAGALFIIGTPNLAIRMNAFALILSAIVILLLPNVEIKDKDIPLQRINITLISNDWSSILTFSKTNIYVTLVYILFSMITVFMTALDSLEAAFATEVLSLSNSTYGFLVSIAGGGIIAGSIVNALFANKLKLNLLIGLGAFFTPIGYIIFAFSADFIWASIGFFTLTFFLSFANIGFLTFYQNNVPVDIMGRFSSILGMLEAGFIIVLTLTIGLATELFEIRPVYIVGSIAFFGLGLIILFNVAVKSKSHYFGQV